ncbi:MAG: hypothetical protein J3R72DRAFT_244646 [Linnemannia gamsii]|nr:MAG: hypothetical protein J3R72DRAFT_244646 [Linnemannia gamsii]
MAYQCQLNNSNKKSLSSPLCLFPFCFPFPCSLFVCFPCLLQQREKAGSKVYVGCPFHPCPSSHRTGDIFFVSPNRPFHATIRTRPILCLSFCLPPLFFLIVFFPLSLFMVGQKTVFSFSVSVCICYVCLHVLYKQVH